MWVDIGRVLPGCFDSSRLEATRHVMASSSGCCDSLLTEVAAPTKRPSCKELIQQLSAPRLPGPRFPNSPCPPCRPP